MNCPASSLSATLGALLVILSGCSDSLPPFEPSVDPAAPRATQLVPASPTAFHAPPASRVSAPTVVVLDQYEQPMANLPVHFTVVFGDGFLANRVAATDAEGRATAGSWILDVEPGDNVAVARVEGLFPVAFMATGALEPVDAVYGFVSTDAQDMLSGRVLGAYYVFYEDSTFVRGRVTGFSAESMTYRQDGGVVSRADSLLIFDRGGYRWQGILRGDSLIAFDLNDLVTEVYALTPEISPPGEYPPVNSLVTVYNRQTPHSHPNGALSRYVLYPDNRFGLQYATSPSGYFEYPGRYSRADSVITFDFDAWSLAGPWQATGTLRGDLLSVEYNIVMLLSDFEDGVYVRAPGDATGAAHLYLASADGSAITRLTPGSWPAWSPDGQRVAFQRDGDIYVINADGSGEVRVAAGSHPAWSPDGTRIGFTSSEGISVMRADGAAITTLIRHDFRDDTYAPWDMGVGKPAWSRDGEHIAFEHLGDGDIQPAQIYVMNADGSDPHLLTSSPDGRRYAESDPSWSPDGSRIAFWSFGSGIAAVDANGGVPNTIYQNFPTVAYGARPSWSPDGSTIAFSTFRGSASGPAVWIVSANGGGARVLIPDGYDVAWSPDGARLAFVRGSRPTG